MNKILQIGSVLLFCAFNAFEGSAQNQTQIQELLARRTQLAAQSQDYAEVEKEIVGLGEMPPALVTKVIGNTGGTLFNFTTYKDIRPESESRIAGRIMSTINGVESIEISNRHISILFNNTATEADINEFFRLMGYTSYTIKTN